METQIVKISNDDFDQLKALFYRKTEQLAKLAEVDYFVVYGFLYKGTEPRIKNRKKIVLGMVRYLEQEKQKLNDNTELIERLSQIAA